MISVGEQFLSFLAIIAIGGILGILIDAYRGFHRTSTARPIVMNFRDFFLWLLLACFAFFLLLLNNWGEVRIYVLLGMGLGYLIYKHWFSRYVLYFWIKLFYWLGRIFRLIFRSLAFPFKILKKTISFLLSYLQRIVDKVFQKPSRILQGKLKRIKFRLKNLLTRK